MRSCLITSYSYVWEVVFPLIYYCYVVYEELSVCLYATSYAVYVELSAFLYAAAARYICTSHLKLEAVFLLSRLLE